MSRETPPQPDDLPTPRPHQDSAQSDPPAASQARTALVVEDVQEVAFVVQLYLERLSLKTEQVGTALAALESLEKQPPDLIILDIGMPEMSGWEFLELLKQRGLAQDVPVIVMTAYTDPDSRNKGYHYGVKAYLNKPILYKQIRDAVKRVLDPADTDPISDADRTTNPDPPQAAAPSSAAKPRMDDDVTPPADA